MNTPLVTEAYDDILCSDLGAFCELVITESVRDELDGYIQRLACTISQEDALMLGMKIRTTIKRAAWAAADRQVDAAEVTQRLSAAERAYERADYDREMARDDELEGKA